MRLKVAGRFPYSVTPQGVACYVEFYIHDSENLQDFLRTPDNHRDLISIKMLEMYVSLENLSRNEISPTPTNTQPSEGVIGVVLS